MNIRSTWSGLEVPEDLSLIVGWKHRDRFAGGEVRVPAASRFTCDTTIEQILHSELRLYTPDMHLEDEEVLVAPEPDLVADSPLAAIVLPTEPLQVINAQSIPRRRYSCTP